MSWSYGGDPSSSDLDAVRFLIGDTDTSDQQLSDEEINYLLSIYPDPNRAAIAAIEGIIAKLARFIDQKTGDIDVKYSQRITHYKDLKATLTSKLAKLVAPYAGGLSKDERDTDRDDEDLKQPQFEVGMTDHPLTDQLTDEEIESS